MVLVPGRAQEAGGPVIGHLVEGVRAEDPVPARLPRGFFEDRQERPSPPFARLRRRAREVEEGGQQVGEGDEVGVGHPRFLPRFADDQRQVHARVEQRGLGVEKRCAVVGEEDDEGFLGEPGVGQRGERQPDAPVEPVDRAVIGGKFRADLRQVGEEGRHMDVFGREDRVVGAELIVAEAAPGLVAVRIDVADGQEEGLAVFVAGVEIGARALGDPGDVARAALFAVLPGIDRRRADMDLADDAGVIARGVEQRGRGRHVVESHEMVEIVVQPVLPGLMGMEPGVDYRAACGTGRGRSEGHVEARALPRQRVDVGRADRGFAVAAGHAAEVVGDQEEDVHHGAVSSLRCGSGKLSGAVSRGKARMTRLATAQPAASRAA